MLLLALSFVILLMMIQENYEGTGVVDDLLTCSLRILLLAFVLCYTVDSAERK